MSAQCPIRAGHSLVPIISKTTDPLGIVLTSMTSPFTGQQTETLVWLLDLNYDIVGDTSSECVMMTFGQGTGMLFDKQGHIFPLVSECA